MTSPPFTPTAWAQAPISLAKATFTARQLL